MRLRAIKVLLQNFHAKCEEKIKPIKITIIYEGSGGKGFLEILRDGCPVGFGSVKFLGFDILIRGDDCKAGDLVNAELLRQGSASQLIDVNTKEDELLEEVLGARVSID